MPAKVKPGHVLSSFLINLRRVRDENLESIFRDLAESKFQVMGSIIVRVIHPHKPDCVAITFQRMGIIYEHAYTSVFKIRDCLNTIMIPEHPEDPVFCPDLADYLPKPADG
jgi:hypothetical protein